MQEFRNISLDKIIRATAGAGKTTNLLSDVYTIFLDHFGGRGVFPRMLISTFTVKAASELSERLIQKAESLEDRDFLAFVTSSYLEVGTMHSVFAKLINSSKSFESTKKNQYVSNTYKKSYMKSIFYKILKEKSLEEFFIDAEEESEVLALFLSMNHSKSNEFFITSYDDFLGLYKNSLKRILESLKKNDEELDSLIDRMQGFKENKYLLNLVLERIESGASGKSVYKKLKKTIEDEKNSEKFLQKYLHKHCILLEIYKQWSLEVESFVKEHNLYTLEDVESEFYKLISKGEFQDISWDYCFFDEYQDTSPIQKEIIDFLTRENFRYYVGDPFQSIYFFRGARKEIFDQEFKRIELESQNAIYNVKNYRSASNIVNFVNKVSRLMMPSFTEMLPQVEGVKGVIEVAHFKDGGLDDEIEYIYKKTLEIQEGSVAILSKTIKSLMSCARVLKAKGLNVRLSLSKGFETSLEVCELCAFLKFLVDPEEDYNLLILLFSNWFDFTDEEIQSFVAVSKEDGSLWSSICTSIKSNDLKQALEMFVFSPPSLVLNSFLIQALDLTDHLDATGLREKNILKFYQALCEEEKKQGFNLEAFCDDILNGDYPFESEQLDNDNTCVLMTIHGSKGLQFDHVFILASNFTPRTSSSKFYLKEGVFSIRETVSKAIGRSYPHLISELIKSLSDEEEEERKRLFYVAMTRAKKGLYIVGSKKISVSRNSKISWMKYVLQSLDSLNEKKDSSFKLITELDKVEQSLSEKSDVKVFGMFENMEPFTFLEENDLSVTGLISQSRDEVYNIDNGLNLYSKFISDGVLFHEFMERVSSEVNIDELLFNYFGEENLKHRKALEYLFSQKEMPFRELISKGFKEWGFDSLVPNDTNGVKSGKIDLWGLINDVVWIVDYKTGATKELSKGFSQLRQYKEILMKIHEERKLTYKLVLCFPYKERIFIE